MDGTTGSGLVRNRKKYASKVGAKGRGYVRFQPKKATNPRGYRKAMRKTYKRAKGASKIIPVMSQCALDYFKAQYDPWNLSNAPCVPDLIQLPSFKFMTRIRGSFQTNAVGYGCIVLNPFTPSNSASTAAITNVNYLAPLWYTNGAHAGSLNLAGTCIFPGTASPAGYVPGYWNSPITSNNVIAAMDNVEGPYVWRPVGGGIKVTYAGKLQDRAGTYILYEDPSNSGWLANRTPTVPEIMAFEETQYTVVTGDEVCVTYHPRNNMDLDYSDNWYMTRSSTPILNSSELAQYQTMAITVQGAPSLSFNFDVVMHWEGVGTSFSSRTKSHSDPNGFSKVTNSFDTQPSTDPPKKNYEDKLKQIIKEHGGTIRAGASYFGGHSNPYASAVLNVMDVMDLAYPSK